MSPLPTCLVLLLASVAGTAAAAVTTTVVDIPVPGASQRYLLVAPDEPIATIVSVPGGTGVYGIQPNGSMTTRVARCSPVARVRQALAQRGIAIALVDADSRGFPWVPANIVAVMRDLQQRFDVPQYLMGGSASTSVVTNLAVSLPGDLRGGLFLTSPGFPEPATGRIVRPTQVIYHVADFDQFGTQTYNALTSAAVRELVALEGGNGANCGHHLFDGLDAQYADATASFIETYNHLFLDAPPLPAVVALTANTVAELRQAIATANQAPQQAHAIAMGASPLQFDVPAAAGDALPHVIGQVVLQPSPALQAQGVFLRGGGPGSGFRLASVGQGGSLEVAGITAEDFHAAGNGGVLAFAAGSRGHVRRSSFVGNAAANGGAIHAAGALAVSDSRFVGNQAEEHGGAINLGGSGATVIERNVFEDNVAGSSGGTLRVSGSYLPGQLRVAGNQVRAAAGPAPIALSDGVARFQFNTVDVATGGAAFLSTGAAVLQGNVLNDRDIATARRGPAAGGKLLCSGAASSALASHGANVATEPSCGLDQASDLVTAAPGLELAQGLIVLATDSPALERGPAEGLVAAGGNRFELPCGYRDIRGLGRPQDADGDGVFACDSGAWELQAGADLDSRQSGAYYDPARSGEGHLVELIGGGLAVVSTYTYGMDGGMAWFTGVGRVVGNTVVVDDMTMTSGGVFGPGFDPDAVVRTRVGGASFVFSDCDAVDRPGHFAFQASHPGAFEDLATSANRLTAILPCSGGPAALVHRSGSYYDPARSGEGVFVQYLPNGGVVLVFYGYTPQGQQFWAIAGSTTLDGDTLTAQMVYPAGTSRFGSHFSPDEVELQPWGTMTLQHTGCNTARLGYHSTIAGYGSGSHDYVRLTAIDGTRCP